MVFAAIDLKSFYASCECVERGLDPLSVNLVVADGTRTDKTICLAVTPTLKAYGVPSRPRLFEVIAKVREINARKRWYAKGHSFRGKTYDDLLLKADPDLALDYIVAPPRMAMYIEYSRRIYSIYLKYFAPEDVHVYSVDEVFIDLTKYISLYKLSADELCSKVIGDVFDTTGITATVGIGTNLYLAKVAMDIVAKRITADGRGARIASLNEKQYREMLWEHRPITDFWRVGRGYEKRLRQCGMFTMGDVALMSLKNEDLLYRMFGVNAELLIDHAWGVEPCTMEDIKAYRPLSSSLSSGQVLSCPYDCERARIIITEMCDALSLDMVAKGIVSNHLTLTVGYDRESLGNKPEYDGDLSVDFYGRRVPKHAHGSADLGGYTSSASTITECALGIFDKCVDKSLLVRRITVCVTNVRKRGNEDLIQLDFFSDADSERDASSERELKLKEAELKIKTRFGKNAILRGISFEEGATAIERNLQIGGHKA